MRSASFEFRILGPLEVLRDGDHVGIQAPKLRALLVSLLLSANDVVAVETLIDRLWGESPPRGARNTLQNYVLRLRRLLGSAEKEGPLLTHSRGYSIELAPGALDLHRFDALVSRARAAAGADQMGRAATLLAEGLRLWRGEALSDIPSEVLRRDIVPLLDERRLDALESRIEADLALGRHADVLAELHELTTAHPLRERFWAQRMLALYRCGRRGESLRCYLTVRNHLAEELGVDPGAALRALNRRVLSGDPALTYARRPKARGNLPAEVTTFVGRQEQLAEIRRLLRANRLVTLTGVGGVGKTRLALRAGAELGEEFSDGVWLADLIALSEAPLLNRMVAQALGIHDQSACCPTDVLAEFLRDRRLLLVLDNCEHVVGAVAALVDVLLRAASGLHVLATSRHRLGLLCEHSLVVPPLAFPPASFSADDGRSLTGYDAVALLTARTAASATAFRVTRDNQELVAQLCRRLDGIPLAIELAAVRLSTLSVAEILERLDDRFRLLATDNTRVSPWYHQTLQDVIDWSYELCTEPERRLWVQLSVFPGGFDLRAAEAVCSGPGIARDDVLPLLTSLAHKSILLVSVCGRRTRYRLLETIREYGRQRLDDAGTRTAIRRRHRDHYQRMAAQAADDWCGDDEIEWLSKLRRELSNFRAALDFSLTQPDEILNGVDIAVNLTRTRVWFFGSTIGEGRHWLERAYGAAHELSPRHSGGAVALLAWITLIQGERSTAERLLAVCRDLGVRSPDDDTRAVVTYVEGSHALLAHGDIRAISLLALARGTFRRAGKHGDAHMATMLWAMACAFLGDRDLALGAAGEYLAEAKASGAGWACSWALWTLGVAELRHGDVAESADLLRETLRRQYDIGDRWGPVWSLEALAWAAAAAGAHRHAAELLGSAYRLRQITGVALIGLRPFHDMHRATERLTRRALGAQAYAAAFDRGRHIRNGTRYAIPPTASGGDVADHRERSRASQAPDSSGTG